VTQVHDRGAGHVVGVEGALAVGVGVGVVGAAAHAGQHPVARLGVGPQDADLGVLGEGVRRVVQLRRWGHGAAQPVEVVEVRQHRRGVGGDGGTGLPGRDPDEGDGEAGQDGEGAADVHVDPPRRVVVQGVWVPVRP
jgi:hypothetical protein